MNDQIESYIKRLIHNRDVAFDFIRELLDINKKLQEQIEDLEIQISEQRSRKG